MNWVDIFYLTLVLCALCGFAIALAYYSQQDTKFRIEREKTGDTAKPSPKPAPAVSKVLEHA